MMESAPTGRPAHMMSFTDSLQNILMNNYANWDGRASRSEYWWFFLFTVILQFIALAIDITVLGYDFTDPAAIQMVGMIVGLALFLPALCVIVRRLHDLGKSGLWFWIIFIPLLGIIVFLVFMATEGEQLPNQYGDVPTNTLDQGGNIHTNY
tara:strand:- start:48 stop:503 length:456 start_codon:yes stop_codon:yes gene_type:complete